MKDVLLGGGLLAGGLALGIGSYIAQGRASKRAEEAFKDAIKHAKKAEMGMRSLNKIRRISGNDVNIGQMNEDIQDMGMRDNAFYIEDPEYKEYAKKLIAKKAPGNLGTIAIGDDARALPVVAHELGHAENNRTGRMGKRLLGTFIGGGIGLSAALARYLWGQHKSAENRWIRDQSDRDNLIKEGLIATGLMGLGASVGDAIAGHSVFTEEEQASKNAMQYLEKMRRTKDQLARDRRTLDAALDTYRTARNWGVLRTLGLAAAFGGGTYLFNKFNNDVVIV